MSETNVFCIPMTVTVLAGTSQPKETSALPSAMTSALPLAIILLEALETKET